MYIKTTYRYADIVEVYKHHSSRYGDHRKRRKKQQETTESVKNANDRKRREHLYRIMAANFREGDAHVTLTYKAEEPDAKKEMQRFLKNMRRAMKRAGKELKYIYVTEKTKRGKEHHHIVMNVTDTALIRKMWTAGSVKISPLYPEKDYEKLAEYLLKQETEKGKKRYQMSRNMIIPKPEVEIIKAGTWKEEPVPEQGYWVPKDSIITGMNADGYPYQKYKMIRVDNVDKSKQKQLEREGDKYIKCRKVSKRKREHSARERK